MVLLSDEFDGTSLGAQWTLVDPVGDASVSVADGMASLAVPGVVSHHVDHNTNSAPYIHQEVGAESDFDVQVKFNSVVHGRDDGGHFQSQGLICYAADGVDRVGCYFYNNTTRSQLFVFSRVGGVGSSRFNGNIIPYSLTSSMSMASHLRMVKQGDSWDIQVSGDGIKWTSKHQFTQAFTPHRVGILGANTSPGNQPITVRADWFHVGTPSTPALPNVTRTTLMTDGFTGSDGDPPDPLKWVVGTQGVEGEATIRTDQLRLRNGEEEGSRGGVYTLVGASNIGALFRYRFGTHSRVTWLVPSFSAMNTPAISGGGAGTSEGFAAGDPYGPPWCYAAELGSKNNLARFFRIDSPADDGAYVYNQYAQIGDDTPAQSQTTYRWCRFERVQEPGGARGLLRMRTWQDGVSEPSTWDWYGWDGIHDGPGRFYLAHGNNSASGGAELADVFVDDVEVYELDVESPPPKVTGLTANPGDPGEVDLSWDPAQDATSYEVERDSVVVGSVTGTTFTDTDLTPGGSYTYRVRAVGDAGTGPYSDPVIGTAGDEPLDQVTGLAAVTGDTGQILLSWDPVTDATSYEVERNSEFAVEVASTSVTDTGLDPGESYTYRVRAVGVAGAGPFSDQVVGTAGDEPADKVTGLVAQATAPDGVLLSWDPVVGATSYEVERDSVVISSTVFTEFSESGLTVGTIYTYRVRVAGSPNWSDPVEVAAGVEEGEPSVPQPAPVGRTTLSYYPPGAAAPFVARTQDRQAVYRLRRLEGITSTLTDLQTEGAPLQVGETPVDVDVPPRVVEATIMTLPTSRADRWEVRQRLAGWFAYHGVNEDGLPRLGLLRLDRGDGLPEVEIEAAPRNSPREVGLIGRHGTLWDVEWVAPDAYWRTRLPEVIRLSPDEAGKVLESPLESPLESAAQQSAIDVFNRAHIPVGVLIQMHGEATDPQVNNVSTGESMIYVGTIPAGSYVQIDTRYGRKSAVLVDSGGAVTNVMANVSTGEFWQLQPGVQTVRYLAASSPTGHALVEWRPLLAGV